MTKPYCYHIDQFSELQPVIHRVIEYSTKMGLDMIQGDHEDAPGQLELNFAFGRAEDTADRLTTYRQVCRQVGREFGLFPCFMPKPFIGRLGQRLPSQHFAVAGGRQHVHCPRETTRECRARLVSTLLAAVLTATSVPLTSHHGTDPSTPTVDSRTPGFWAPVFADWGFQNRTTALRVSAPGRFEYRSVDSAVNPYLSMAALLVSMRDGLDQSIDPGPPEEGNIYEAIEAGQGGGTHPEHPG